MNTEAQVETRKFEAATTEVLHLVTHALYSNREVFLRELVSNASDACDKLRFAALSDAGLLGEDTELRIDVSWDPVARTVTVSDNGIGMSRTELVDNIGTIASSGTRRFLAALSGEQKQDARLIGQFGVGFYAAFVVADRVTVRSRRADAAPGAGTEWESDGRGEYTLRDVELPARGTQITLHLKADADEFLQPWTLRGLIERYSRHIAFPIRMPKVEDGKPGAELETVNAASALWTRQKSEVTDAEYAEFYKSLGNDFNAPLAWSHNHVEGRQRFTTLLYIPAQPPFDLMLGARDERKGVKLYIKRVFVMDAAEALLPNYLRFVRGVVDADDLPLNVSRELLQHDRKLETIRASCVKRVLDTLEKLARTDTEKFTTFWKAFGNVLKEGIVEDPDNRERIAGLLRFASTRGEGAAQTVALATYVERMQGDQERIWYASGESWAAAAGSPQLEAFKARDIEVLLLSDRVDEWMLGSLREFGGKPLANVAREAPPLDAAAREQQEAAGKEAEPLLARLRELLGDAVTDVRVSARLTESPSCIALGEQDLAPHLARLLREAGQEVPDDKPVLEINPGHELLQRLAAEEDATRAADLAHLLLEQAEIASGAALADPAAFVRRVNRLLGAA